MSRVAIILMMVLTVCASLITGLSEGMGDVQRNKTGCLLVAFGTSVPEARVAYEHVQTEVHTAFPDLPLRWAYTSGIVRRKLAEQGVSFDSVAMALARMREEGFAHAAVQSLHIISGREYHDLISIAKAFAAMAEGFRNVSVGRPLLSGEKDMVLATNALLKHIPERRERDEAVVFMGHGSHHPAHALYYALQYHLQQRDPNIFLGTVENRPSIEDIKGSLLARGIGRAYLMPLMAVAGDHALHDMAGDSDDSWSTILHRAGIQTIPVLKGLGEYKEVVSIWIAHLEEALKALDSIPNR